MIRWRLRCAVVAVVCFGLWAGVLGETGWGPLLLVSGGVLMGVALNGFLVSKWGSIDASTTNISHQADDRSPRAVDVPVLELLERMEAGVVATDADFRVTLCNSAAREMFNGGSNTGLAIGGDIRELDAMRQLITPFVGLEPAGTVDVELTLEGMPSRVVMAHCVRNAPTDERVIFLHEITEMKQLETMRRDFVANLSHELRTPVSVICANAETLLDGALEDEQVARDFVVAMERNATRLSRLVADLLDLARIEAGSHELDLVSVDVSAAVGHCFASVVAKSEAKRIALVNEVEPGLVVHADVGSLDQVLVNLVENAIKYGTEEGSVWVRAYRVPDQIRVEIIDDGPGISAKHRGRLFERFYRVDKGRSREAGGTGLGLAIVKHLVNSMGGDIGMEPKLPSGAVFWFTLGLEPTHD